MGAVAREKEADEKEERSRREQASDNDVLAATAPLRHAGFGSTVLRGVIARLTR